LLLFHFFLYLNIPRSQLAASASQGGTLLEMRAALRWRNASASDLFLGGTDERVFWFRNATFWHHCNAVRLLLSSRA
jgi:hypothetical protein